MKTACLNSFFSASLLLLLPACDFSAKSAIMQHEAQHKRGLAENAQRIALGMRPIDAKWICFRCIGNRDEWISDPVNDIAAIKSVDRDMEGKALLEVDQYISGRKYTNLEGDVSDEELCVECDWKTGVISLTYLGDDRAFEKAIAKLPPFSTQTRSAYLDLVTSIVRKWKIIR